ncbi:GFA family protein [Aliishimia ponticola]|uniref:GFA family protein n=1 Tax=Aliishimia ponticola TaxID=2499833 RepID=A0A4S4N855_9RHOB|nr:GFA family protein [Aliishimia ponticola]THH34735.1 GFA family protein [Aliishimia ponticola]
MAQHLKGQCLCGAVTVSARAEDAPRLRVCHCDMCQRHCSGGFFSIETEQAGLRIDGPVGVYESSDWAERGFCSLCGSTLYYRTPADGVRNLSAGLFDNAGNGDLTTEFYSDMCPQGYALAGQHSRLSATETIALFAPK